VHVFDRVQFAAVEDFFEGLAFEWSAIELGSPAAAKGELLLAKDLWT